MKVVVLVEDELGVSKRVRGNANIGDLGGRFGPNSSERLNEQIRVVV